MDCCYLSDADLTTLASLTMITNLEKLDISLERNKLTPGCLSSLVVLNKTPNLKEILLSLGGNSLDDNFFVTLKDNFKGIKYKIHEEI